ncbi:DotI/IcmL family type IV secretion protein [Aeromonas sp. 23P]|uniref:DotI/IcmL family type IV secretion protein n=1 Tax=Aeromonas sp. 23P TaxID=3452716 RepID=UPI003F7A9DDE|nr:DotI/IcmL/TraM family protein [Aeromonas veronii]
MSGGNSQEKTIKKDTNDETREKALEAHEDAVLLRIVSRNIERMSAVEAIALRNSLLCLLCIVVTIGSLLFSFFVYKSSLNKDPKYFTKNPAGEYYEIRALDQPSFEEEWVAQYAVKALVRTFTFSFNDYVMRLDDAYKSYYTPVGRDSVQKGLESSLILKTLVQNELFLSLSIDEAAYIQKTGVRDGQYVWEVHTRGVLTYRNSKGSPTSQPIRIRCWVVQVDTADNPAGMAIESIQWVNDNR